MTKSKQKFDFAKNHFSRTDFLIFKAKKTFIYYLYKSIFV